MSYNRWTENKLLWTLIFENLKVCVFLRSVGCVCAPSSSFSQPWTSPGKGSSPWQRKGGVESNRAPSPILCGHGWVQARPDLLGTHMAAGTSSLRQRDRVSRAPHRQKERMENEGMNHCFSALWQKWVLCVLDVEKRDSASEETWWGGLILRLKTTSIRTHIVPAVLFIHSLQKKNNKNFVESNVLVCRL